eukprot:GFUD01042815.1.p1 GENE.GFUD01042815.1~~GFUD01042815.1.p1  ORF type:complete len:461 (+),score=141.27 GFUD01042815.1:89-1471(+)
MSDNSNDGVSDEDNYALAYGDYDDMEDMEDICDVEIDYGEENYLFEFDPFVEYSNLKGDYVIHHWSLLGEMAVHSYVLGYSMKPKTYQSLVELAEMTCQLLVAWKKRKSSSLGNEPDVESEVDYPFYFYNSVAKLLHIFGSEEAVLKFEEEVNQIAKFLRKCLQGILERCLPPCLSLLNPVMPILLTHLLEVKGLHKLGQVMKKKSTKKIEQEHMDTLYLILADIYDQLKGVMFIESNTCSRQPSLIEKKASLLIRYKLLTELVKSSNPESGQYSLEIETTVVADSGSEMEIIEKTVGEDTSLPSSSEMFERRDEGADKIEEDETGLKVVTRVRRVEKMNKIESKSVLTRLGVESASGGSDRESSTNDDTSSESITSEDEDPETFLRLPNGLKYRRVGQVDEFLDFEKLFGQCNGGIMELVQLPEIFLEHPTVSVTESANKMVISDVDTGEFIAMKMIWD